MLSGLSPKPALGREDRLRVSNGRRVIAILPDRSADSRPNYRKVVAPLGSEFGAACFVERKIPWHLSIGGKAERYDRLKLVPALYGIREGKRQGRAAATPYLRRDCSFSVRRHHHCFRPMRKREDSHPRKRRPNARSVAISAPLKKSEATNYTWDLGELGAGAAVPGSDGTLRFKASFTPVGGFWTDPGRAQHVLAGCVGHPRATERESLLQSKKNLHP